MGINLNEGLFTYLIDPTTEKDLLNTNTSLFSCSFSCTVCFFFFFLFFLYQYPLYYLNVGVCNGPTHRYLAYLTSQSQESTPYIMIKNAKDHYYHHPLVRDAQDLLWVA